MMRLLAKNQVLTVCVLAAQSCFSVKALSVDALSAHYSGYTLTVEATAAVIESNGTTYRFYVNSNDPSDKFSAVLGNNDDYLIFDTPGGIFNSALNEVWNASEISPSLLAVFPELIDDSFATVNLTVAQDFVEGAQDASLVEDSGLSPTVSQYFTTGGTSLNVTTLTGASWYVLNTAANALPDEDGRWLVAQITTTGNISGQINFQIFPLGVGADFVQTSIFFDGAGTYSGSGALVPGCMDADACNYDPSATEDDGSCVFIPNGDCDCDGNVLDAVGVCGGACTQDDNMNGVCDDIEVYGCTDPTALNYNPQANVNSDTCVFPVVGCTDPTSCNYDPSANTSDGSCDFESCYGCLNEMACNYDPSAIYMDAAQCDFVTCAGCPDPTACNYDPIATLNDGSCDFADAGCQECVSGASATIDTDGDGVADCDEVSGCMDAMACNYNMDATDADDCEYAAVLLDCDGQCLNDFDSDGVCDELEISGCTYQAACNYDEFASNDDGSCIYAMEGCQTCSGQSDGTGFVVWSDVDGDGICDFNEVEGCTNSEACNFLESATDNDGSCEYDSCAGCTDEWACNYNAAADLNDGSCEYESCTGCMDGSACNYDPEATLPGECDLESCFGCTDWYACNYSPPSIYDDGSCEYESCAGCMDESACNYDAWATLDSGLCFTWDECGVCGGSGIPEGDCDCYGNQLDALGVCGGGCASDFNANGLCDEFESCGYLGLDFWLDEPFGLHSEALIQGQPIELFVGDYFEVPLLINVPAVFVDEVTETAFQVFQWADISVQGLPPGVDLLFDDQIAGATQACFSLVGGDFPIEEGFWEVTIEGEMFLNVFGSPFGIGPLALSFGVQVQPNPNGVGGCTYPQASNFTPWATFDVGVCVFEGCTDPEALNYDTTFDLDDGSCIYSDPDCGSEPACAEDLNGDGAVGTPDLLQMLAEFGNECE